MKTVFRRRVVCLLWVTACILNVPYVSSADGGDHRQELLLSHGIVLSHTPFSEAWTEEEKDDIRQMVEHLPSELQWVENKGTGGKPIRFIKNSRMVSFGYKTVLSPPNCPGRPQSSNQHIRGKYDLPVSAQVLYALLKHYDDEKRISAKKQWLTINEWEPVPIH